MENRSASRSAAAGDEQSSTTRSGSTVPPKRPVTKPIAPRLTTSTSSTRPPATSRTTSTISQSSLSKPPTRPTTTSTARRPVATESGGNQPTTAHRSQPSTTSVETSADESRKDGITARPKRMSLAASTGAAASQRLSSSRTPATTTSVRRTPATPTATSRTSVTSPTSTTKRPLASTIRTPSTLSSRTRPLSSASARPSTLADRKRLSTIPASPAVQSTKKSVVEPNDVADSGTEQELSEAEAVEKTDISDAEASSIPNQTIDAAAELERIREELEQSRSEVTSLQSQLEVAESKAAEIEALAQSNTGGSQTLDNSDELSENTHKTELEGLRNELEVLKQDREDAVKAKDQEIGQLTDEVRLLKASTTDTTSKDAKVKDLEDEIVLLKQEAEAPKEDTTNPTSSSQAQELVEARQELEATKTRHAAAKENVKSKIAKAADMHAREKADLEEAHKSEIEALKAKSDTLETGLAAKKDELDTARKDQDEIHKELEKLRKAHDEHNQERAGLIQTLEAQLAEATGKVDSQNKEISAADQKLTQELEAAVEALESTKRDHEQATAALRVDYESREADAIRSSAVEHERKMSELTSKLSHSHDAAIEEMKSVHAEQLHQLEEQSKSALVDLEGLETSNARELEKVKSDAQANHAEAIRVKEKEHQRALEQLRSDLASAEAELKMANQGHAQELEKLQSKYRSDEDSRFAELTSQHERQLSELKSTSSKAQDDVVARLKASHAEQSKKQDDQTRAALSEAEAAKIQSATMKGIIGDLEKEMEQSKKDHEEELGKLQEEFSQAIMKLSVQSEKLSQHDTQISETRASAESEKTKAIESITQQHEQTLQIAKKELTAAHESTLQKLRDEHSRALDAANGQIKKHEDAINDLKAQHERNLDEMSHSKDLAAKETIAEREATHARSLDALRGSLRSDHDNAMSNLRKEHANTTAQEAKQASDALNQLKSEHDQVVAVLQSQSKDLQEKLTDTSKFDSLRAELSGAQESLKNLKAEHSEQLATVSAEHAIGLNKLKEEMQAERTTSTSKIDALQRHLTEALSQHTNLSQEQQKLLEQHEVASNSLQAQLDQANADSASAQSTAVSEMKSLEDRLSNASKTISDLTEQYTHATLEAEIQRQAAEKAEHELASLKQSLLKARESEVSPIAVDTTKASNPKDNKQQSPFSPGLKASKWATDEPSNGVSEPDLPSTPAAKTGSNGDSSLQDDQHRSTPQPKSSSSRTKNRGSKVRGQMAGMTESIRQLDELNEEILDGHRRMAKVLSRVEGDGTLTNGGLNGADAE